MNTWFEIKNIAKNSRKWTVRIFDVIGGFGVSARNFVEQLDAVPDDAEVTLEINSPGGSIIDGWAIYNAIARRRNQVVARIEGMAASMASVVMLAAREVTAAENASVFLHNPITSVYGNAKDLRENADVLDKMCEQLLAVYVAKTGKSRESIQAVMDANSGKGSFLTAAEAKDMGLIDTMFGALKAAALYTEPVFTAAGTLAATAEAFGIKIADAAFERDAYRAQVNELSELLAAAKQSLSEESAKVADIAAKLEQAQASLADAVRESESALRERNAANEATGKAVSEIASLNKTLAETNAALLATRSEADAVKAELAIAKDAIDARDAADLAARAQQAVDAAVADGRIKRDDATRATWIGRYTANEAETITLLASLHPASAYRRGARPPVEHGTASTGKTFDAIRAEFSTITDPEAKRAFYAMHRAALNPFS